MTGGLWVKHEDGCSTPAVMLMEHNMGGCASVPIDSVQYLHSTSRRTTWQGAKPAVLYQSLKARYSSTRIPAQIGVMCIAVALYLVPLELR